MNIWSWIHDKDRELREAGETRLADIIEMIPGLVTNGKHDKVDAFFTEGLALARSRNEKWVEVFLRHWRLQSLVFHRSNARVAQPEAIDLLDFSHREDTRDCPQSICAVQDFANCFDQIDGPGYAEERMNVARETLDRINPSWSCFVCISAEYAAALADADKHEETIAFIEDAERQLIEAGARRDVSNFGMTRAHSLRKLGRFEAARQWLDRIEEHHKGKTFDDDIRNAKARLAADQGQYDEAYELLTDFAAVVEEVDSYTIWLETCTMLANAGKIDNDWQLAATFEKCLDTMIHNGVVRDSIRIAELAIELAMARGSSATSQYLLEKIEKLLPGLAKDLGATENYETLKKQVMNFTSNAPADKHEPYSLQQMIDDEVEDIEAALEQLKNLYKQKPDDETIAVTLSRYYSQMARQDQAITVLNEFVHEHPDSPEALMYLAFRVRDFRSPEEYRELIDWARAQQLGADAASNLDWVEAHACRDAGDFKGAARYLESILAQDQGAWNTRVMLTQMYRQLERYDDAITVVNRLLESEPDDKSLLWDKILYATLIGDWQTVRTICASLDIELDEEEGPIDEVWGTCRIQISGQDDNIYYATRTGPVTAEISEVARLNQPQHYGDRVIFNPAPLNQLDQTDEDGDEVDSEGYDTYLYPCVKITAPGGYRVFDLDGVHPGDDVLEKLTDVLDYVGVWLQQRSVDGEYKLFYDDKEVNAFYGYLVIPAKTGLKKVDEILQKELATAKHPMVWVRLLRELGEQERFQQQMGTVDDYNMVLD